LVLKKINTTRFSDVLKRNTQLTNLQKNVFFTEECPGGDEETVQARGTVNQEELLSKEPATPGLNIYPNPANETLTVSLAPAEDSRTIRIFSAEGMLMKTMKIRGQQTSLLINIRNFRPGIYVINITTGKEMRSYKFIKMGG
jgi:hypothetical protein